MIQKRSSFLQKNTPFQHTADSSFLSASVGKVQAQYERHPYPAHNLGAFLFSNPDLFQSHVLAYEWGQFLRTGRFVSHTSETRILVAGSGTFEPLIVSRAHPKAQVVALDISAKSLRTLQWRARLRPWMGKLQYCLDDLHNPALREKLGTFDYILCTGVLHHSDEPQKMLQNLRALLKPTGLLRLMMYPEHSRYWIYELKKFFSEQGISSNTPSLREACLRAVQALDVENPLRTSFENYSDTQNTAGLMDGFFHAHDKPLRWAQFRGYCNELGLSLLGFGHAWHSQPGAFERALQSLVYDGRCVPKLLQCFQRMGAWQRIEFLDSLHELAVNPVFWLSSEHETVGVGTSAMAKWNPVVERYLTTTVRTMFPGKRQAPLMPPRASWELCANESLKDGFKLLSDHDRERWMTGGLWIGDDGLLPRALFLNRAEARAHASDSEVAHAGGNIHDTKSTLPHANLDRKDESPRTKNIWRALELWLGSDMSELAADALEALESLVEPRIDRKGAELPELSLNAELARLRQTLQHKPRPF